MNLKFIFIFGILLTIDIVLSVLSDENSYECVKKRKSGACKVFNVTEDFDRFIALDIINPAEDSSYRISTIIEIDYAQNKNSFEQENIKKIKEFDTDDNPVVEILFSENENPVYSYRIVLGEKINRLAYVEIVEADEKVIHYNNYSPELPSWPFVINVTIDGGHSGFYDSNMSVYANNGDGFDKATPFLRGQSGLTRVQYMSIRSRNKNVKLIGFYDCSTKYGTYCGTEKTQIITDCREKFSPLGSGFFNNFIDISRFNRLGKDNEENFEFNEVFGIYRRNNDNIHILFSDARFERSKYIRITIDDEIIVRARDYYFEKTAVKSGWNQEPYEPNFIKVRFSSVKKRISIYKLDNQEPILAMKLCDFDLNDFKYMSVTSNRFKSVELYYDCCLPNELEQCHVYERNYTKPEKNNAERNADSNEGISDSTTIQLDDEYTTSESNVLYTTTVSENNVEVESTTEPIESTKEPIVTTVEPVETTMEPTDTTMESDETNIVSSDYDEIDEVNAKIKTMELEKLQGVEKIKTFLDTSNFHKVNDTQYIYENGTSMKDYCPHEIAGVELTQNTEADYDNTDEDDSGISIDPNLLKSLVG